MLNNGSLRFEQWGSHSTFQPLAETLKTGCRGKKQETECRMGRGWQNLLFHNDWIMCLCWKIRILLTRSFSNLLSKVIVFSTGWWKWKILSLKKYMGTGFFWLLFFTDVHKVTRLDGMSKYPAGKNRESVAVKDNFELEVLQAQYKELKEKVRDLTCSFCS